MTNLRLERGTYLAPPFLFFLHFICLEDFPTGSIPAASTLRRSRLLAGAMQGALRSAAQRCEVGPIRHRLNARH